MNVVASGAPRSGFGACIANPGGLTDPNTLRLIQDSDGWLFPEPAFATGSSPTAVAIGDLDGNGLPELVVANYGDDTVSVLRSYSNSSNGVFAPRVDYAAGSGPFSVAIGDLDGDGWPDLAVTALIDNSVGVLHNNGNGTFAARANYASGSDPTSVAIGDLDGDGRPDLVLANYLGDSVSVLRNNRDGTFATRVDYAAGTNPISVAIGDLDGEGRPDLAVANDSDNTVSVLRNTSGGEGMMFTAALELASGNGPHSVAIGDLNGDGRPDLAVANDSSNTVSVLRNTTEDDNLAFADRADYVTGSHPGFVAIVDLDGDARPELAVANFYSSTISVLRNTSAGGAGDGTFATTVDFPAGQNPHSLAIGDLDGDGRPDLAVANSGSDAVSVLRNTSREGRGMMASRTELATGSAPFSVATGDLNGDGRPDLAIANHSSNTVSVLLNASWGGKRGFDARVDFPTGKAPASVVIGDIDGDGRLDLVVADSGSHTVSVLRNTSVGGTCTFAARVAFPTGLGPSSVSIGDLDGDGRLDLAVADYSGGAVSILRNTSLPGALTFAATVSYGAWYAPIAVAIGDLDGDGRPDLVTANPPGTISVKRNLGNGVLDASMDFTVGLSPVSIAVGDLDGDGSLDVAVANYSTSSVTVLRRFSLGGTLGHATRVDYAAGPDPTSVAIADLDGDGRPDLAVTSYLDNTVGVLRSTSVVGDFAFAARQDYATGIGPYAVAIGDLDGDGWPDLAAANYRSDTASVLLNQLTAPPPCPADLNNDRHVNSTDLTLLLLYFGQVTPPGSPGAVADVNANGLVNTADLTLLLLRFGQSCP